MRCKYEFKKACENGDLETVKLIYNENKKVDYDIGDIFMLVCQKGHLNVFYWLHKTFHYYLDKYDVYMYAFDAACCNGNLDIVKFIYHTGAVNSKQYSDSFRTACNNNCFDVVKWLYEMRYTVIFDNVEIINESIRQHINLDKTTYDLLINVKNNQMIQIDDVIEDIIVKALFYYNRVNMLTLLNLPYVSFDVDNGKVINGVIKRCKSKSSYKI